MEQNTARKSGNIIRFFILLFVLIIFPGLSWYYLKSGVSYRKNTLSELKDYGKIAYFDWKTIPTKSNIADSLNGRIVIANFVNPNTAIGKKQTEVMDKLFTQFKDRKDVRLITFLTQTDSTQLSEYALRSNPKHYPNYWILSTTLAEYNTLLNAFKLPQKGNFDTVDCPYLTYINMEGTVANFYDINDNQQLGRLVEHIAMKLTIDKFETPEIKRDKEK